MTAANLQSGTSRASDLGGAAVRVIDAHVHWYPQAFVDLMVREGPRHGAVLDEDAKGNPVVISVPGCTQRSVMRRTMTDPAAIIEAMDERRVDAYALSMTNPLVYWAPPGFGLELAAAHNDACVELHRRYPDRFYGCIVLPMQDPVLAAAELERMARHPCMRAVFIAEHILGRNLHDKQFWPIYERAQALRLPLFLTNLYPTGAERMQEFFMINTVGNPQEAGYAAVSLMCGGVLDAFPELEVFLPHAGGTFPWLIGRLDMAYDTGADLGPLAHRPSTYLRRFHYDLITHDAQMMRHLIDRVGVDRIVAGTDFPQRMGVKRPVDFVESIPGITPKEREAILCTNPARLLGLDRLPA